jgi:hypothetical protein
MKEYGRAKRARGRRKNEGKHPNPARSPYISITFAAPRRRLPLLLRALPQTANVGAVIVDVAKIIFR